MWLTKTQNVSIRVWIQITAESGVPKVRRTSGTSASHMPVVSPGHTPSPKKRRQNAILSESRETMARWMGRTPLGQEDGGLLPPRRKRRLRARDRVRGRRVRVDHWIRGGCAASIGNILDSHGSSIESELNSCCCGQKIAPPEDIAAS